MTSTFGGLRAAVVGTGFIARVHVESLRRIGVEVAGVLGSTSARSQDFAREMQIPTAYSDLDALLGDGGVDVVHICSPNPYHYRQAMGSLRAGKHVVCEKPLATSTDEAKELATVAASSGLVHAVCFLNRFYPLCQEAHARVRDGSLGSLRFVTGHYFQDWLSEESDWNWRIEKTAGGDLRTVGDIGSHWIDLMMFITGLGIDSVMADLAPVVASRQRPLGASQATFQAAVGGTEAVSVESDDTASILFRFAGGTRGAVSLSQVTPGWKNHLAFMVAGSESSLGWSTERPDELWIGNRRTPNQVLLRDPGLLSPQAMRLVDYPGGHAQGFADAFKAMHRSVYAAVQEGQAHAVPFATFEDGFVQMAIKECIRLSSEEQHWVSVRDLP